MEIGGIDARSRLGSRRKGWGFEVGSGIWTGFQLASVGVWEVDPVGCLFLECEKLAVLKRGFPFGIYLALLRDN